MPLFGPGAANILPASLNFVVMGVALWLLFGFVPTVAAIAWTLVIIVLGIPAMYAIGALFAASVLRFGEVGPVVQLVRGVFVLACGITFPVAMLPVWAQVSARFLPPTYIVDDIRSVLLRGADLADVAWDLAFVLAIAVVIAAAAAAVFAALETSARRTGMLSRF